MDHILRGGTPGHKPANKLYYGDNLTVMQAHMRSGSVDLIYLDPPFNSNRTYNLIYSKLTGAPLPEQEEAFCDAWDLDAEKIEMARQMPVLLREEGIDEDVVSFWMAWVNALKTAQPKLLAYLIYMSVRLVQMRKLLKPTGCIYVHCDPSASHYMKVFMDSIFGHQNFRNDIIWKRTNTHNDAKTWSRVSDNILFYSKGPRFTWNTPREAHSEEYVAAKYRHDDGDGRTYRLDNMTSPNPRPNMMYEWRGFPYPVAGWRYSRDTMQRLHDEGRVWYPRRADGADDTTKRPQLKRYLEEMKGGVMGNVWTDILPINSRALDRLGYPTQKPKPLLARIIEASSNPGDVVFDPFCGCGTAIYAAHEAGRRWIGCDIAILSVRIVRDVLAARYALHEGLDYEVSGVPLTVEGADMLFSEDPRQFQHWVVELAGGFSSKAWSNDRGIDGRIYFETSAGLRSMVLSVKGGKLKPDFTREVMGVVSREANVDIGGLICRLPPTRGMLQDAATAGSVAIGGKHYPRLQIRTVADLLAGRGFDTPSHVRTLQWERQPSLL